MILELLTMHNFRQYYRSQHIHFSVDKSRNITVIHGENGAGKTALLNAFSWCLYGQCSLPDPTDIICERNVAEAKMGDYLEAYVTLQFNNDAKTYFATRKVRAKKTDVGLKYETPVLELQYIDEEGKTQKPTKNPQDTINQIIPPELKTYFFFDGERIDNLTKKEGVKDIRKAIKILMGLEVLERGKDHLSGVQKRFRDEKAKYGDNETQRIAAEIDNLEKEIQDKNEELNVQHQNYDAIDGDIAAVRDRLRTLEASRELQKRRDELLNQERTLQNQIGEIRKRLRTTISRQGYLAFCSQAISKVEGILEEKRQKAEIPTGIKRQFVDDLLENGKCICGTLLEPGTLAYESVGSWRNKASSRELEEAFINMAGDLKILAKERTQLFENLKDLQSTNTLLHQRLKENQEEQSEIKSQLRNVEEVASLTQKEQELSIQSRETDQAIGRIKEALENLQRELKKKRTLFNDKKAEGAKAELASRRMNACEKVQNCIASMLEIQSQEVQTKLQRRITEVHSRMLRKGYEAVIDDNYLLSVVKSIGDQSSPVRMSTGERQITSLSFIGAIVDIAREQYEKDKSGYFRGGYYPIVMDSPFGALDDDHKERTAMSVPTLTHQVIVMASSSQWKGPVKKGMSPSIGREYELEYHSPKQDPSELFEYTLIKEVQ